MRKVLIATDKPFASSAVGRIATILSGAGYEVRKLEKYTQKEELLEAVAHVDAMIVRSDIVDRDVVVTARWQPVFEGEGEIARRRDGGS